MEKGAKEAASKGKRSREKRMRGGTVNVNRMGEERRRGEQM